MKKILLTGLVVAALVGCSEATADQPSEPKQEVNNKKAEKSNHLAEQDYLAKLRETYEGSANVAFNAKDKMYTIQPTSDQVSVELLQMIEGTKSMDDWNRLTETYTDASLMIQKQVGSGYTITLLNPVNSDNMLFAASDGVVLYDYFKE